VPNIPNTTSPDLTLVSVGNGTNASRWTNATSGGSGITQLTGDVTAGPGSGSVASTVVGIQGYSVNVTGLSTSGQMLFWTNLGGTGQWVTTYVPTGTGSMLFWNGTSWESTSTTGIATGNVLVWNNSTSKWVPGAAPLTGDVTGTTSSNQVISLAGGQTLALTGANFPVSGSIMQYVTSGSTPAWTTGAAPTQNGQILQWNGFAWAQSDTPAPSNGQTLVWNSAIAPTGKWTPGNITLAGEVTGTTASTSVVKLITYLLPVTGAQMGNFLYYDSTSGKWEYGGARTGGATPSVGDVPVWNATTGWTAGPVSSTPSLLNNSTGSMFQNTSTNVTNTIARVDNMASNFVNGSVTFNGSGGSYPYSLKVPTTGYYQVDGQVYIAAGTATGGYVISLIYVNGSEVMRANSYGTGGAAPHCGGVIALNANDYVQLYAQVQSGSAATSVVAGSLRTFVSLSLVSQ